MDETEQRPHIEGSDAIGEPSVRSSQRAQKATPPMADDVADRSAEDRNNNNDDNEDEARLEELDNNSAAGRVSPASTMMMQEESVSEAQGSATNGGGGGGASTSAGQTKRRRKKKEDNASDPGKMYGVHLSSTMAKTLHKDEAHLLDGAMAVQLVALVEARLASGDGAFHILTSEQSLPYRTVRPSEIVSFLDPPASALDDNDDGDNEVEMVSAIPFQERLPSIGDSIDITTGPDKQERKTTLARYTSVPLSQTCQDKKKNGCLLNAGAHVYSTDWSPKGRARVQADDEEFLCISAALEMWPRTAVMSQRPTPVQPGALQIWSISTTDGGRSARVEMIICLDGGRMACVRWVPLLRTFGPVGAWIGLLAVARQDGLVDVYAVPHPDALEAVNDAEAVRVGGEPVCVRLHALCRLDTMRGAPLSLDWYDVDRLAVGYSDGFVAVWSLSRALKTSKVALARPSVYARVSRTALSAVAWDTSGTHIFSSAYDGALFDTSLAQPDFSTAVSRARDTPNAVAYQADMHAPLFERLDDYGVRILDYKKVLPAANNKLGSRLVYLHYGRIRSLSTSVHHPFVASGGADGTVRAANVPFLMHYSRRWGGAGASTLFRLDVPDRSTGALRLLEHILTPPIRRTIPGDEDGTRRSTSNNSNNNKSNTTLAWHPAICVTDVRWNMNYARETWLASGMAAGLVRIDILGKGSHGSANENETE